MKYIDTLLNKITMYRVVLYSMFTIALAAIVLGFAGVIAYDGFSLIASFLILMFSSYLTNMMFAKLFKAPANVESVYITAFILFFLIEPLITVNGIIILVAVSTIATISKYLFAIHRKHMFNPAAIAAVILTLTGSGAVIWWVATPVLSTLTLILGLLIVRKIKRFPMFATFVIVSIAALVYTYVVPSGMNFFSFAKELLLSWPFVFFATIMLTEPLTTPPTTATQIIYAGIVGLFFASKFTFGPFYSTPELALIIGNIYSYSVSSKQKLMLTLMMKRQVSATVYDFIFESNQQLSFRPGQYLEWTLPHIAPDNRGNRRFFTVASSPTESAIHLGVRIDPNDSSSFKKHLLSMEPGEIMTASHLSGEFTLPTIPASNNVSNSTKYGRQQKLVFIAGGIGITPFRSMVKYMLDTSGNVNAEKRDVVLFYFVNSETDLAYQELFEEARQKIGLRVEYIASTPSPSWQGRTGRMTPKIIAEIVPDFNARYFYLSGPNAMVQNYKKMLRGMGVARKSIKTDYFPGF